MKDLREVLADMDHPEIYYLLNLDELPIFVKKKIIHLISLKKGLLDDKEKERLIANRCVNLQRGKNNIMALDEYAELLKCGRYM